MASQGRWIPVHRTISTKWWVSRWLNSVESCAMCSERPLWWRWCCCRHWQRRAAPATSRICSPNRGKTRWYLLQLWHTTTPLRPAGPTHCKHTHPLQTSTTTNDTQSQHPNQRTRTPWYIHKHQTTPSTHGTPVGAHTDDTQQRRQLLPSAWPATNRARARHPDDTTRPSSRCVRRVVVTPHDALVWLQPATNGARYHH